MVFCSLSHQITDWQLAKQVIHTPTIFHHVSHFFVVCGTATGSELELKVREDISHKWYSTSSHDLDMKSNRSRQGLMLTRMIGCVNRKKC